jgi:hypothetical protein
VRDCRLFQGHYLDAFIYPEAQIEDQIDSLLRIKDGIVLYEENGYGTWLLDEVRKIYQKGPEKTPDFEKEEITVWLDKMLNRARVGDVEGNFRRHWLLHDLLECYFKLRDKWYLGPKESFQWLKINDKLAFNAFEKALLPNSDLANIQELIRVVTHTKV